MPRPFPTGSPDASVSPPVRLESTSRADSAERLRRWAELIAVGEATLDAELSPSEIRIVLTEVARLRRQRLVRLVARAIAQDLLGDGGRSEEV